MRYRGLLQIAKGNQQKLPLNRMRHAYSQVLRLCALLILCGLAACSETLTTSESSPPSSQQLQREYDKTLTKAEQQAVISDMQSATAKKAGDTGAENDAATEVDNTN